MPDIALELDATAVNKALDKLAKEGKTKPLMDSIGRVLLSDAQLNFRNQQDPDGNKWKPTQRGGQILRDTGLLRNSLHYEVIGIDTVKIGTNLPYGVHHQYGTKHIPARPFLGVGDKQVNKINNAIDAWMDSLLG